MGHYAVVYTITTAIAGLPVVGYTLGRLRVQMLDSTHLKAEMFSPSASAADFTSAAQMFMR